MNGSLVASEQAIRIAAFGVVFLAMAFWELAAPRRRPTMSRRLRWANNLAVVALDATVVRLVLPAAAVGFAATAAANGWGLLPALDLPQAVAVVVAVLVLDLAIYLQHVLFHAVPALWRLHRMHHADMDFDVTTGLRFHPLEILLSLIIKLAVIAALGPPVVAVLAFELLLNATSMFNHGNVRMPAALDRLLRLVVVTPDMHRVHHSVRPTETNSNFGFNLPWWDCLLGTYRAQPAAGHEAMTIGIGQFRAPRELWLDRMLTQPLRGPADDYPLARQDSSG